MRSTTVRLLILAIGLFVSVGAAGQRNLPKPDISLFQGNAELKERMRVNSEWSPEVSGRVQVTYRLTAEEILANQNVTSNNRLLKAVKEANKSAFDASGKAIVGSYIYIPDANALAKGVFPTKNYSNSDLAQVQIAMTATSLRKISLDDRLIDVPQMSYGRIKKALVQAEQAATDLVNLPGQIDSLDAATLRSSSEAIAFLASRKAGPVDEGLRVAAIERLSKEMRDYTDEVKSSSTSAFPQKNRREVTVEHLVKGEKIDGKSAFLIPALYAEQPQLFVRDPKLLIEKLRNGRFDKRLSPATKLVPIGEYVLYISGPDHFDKPDNLLEPLKDGTVWKFSQLVNITKDTPKQLALVYDKEF